MSSIGTIRKLTSTRFLNLYELEAVHRDGRVSPYYMASRTRDPAALKAVTKENQPDGVILYGVYGERKDRVGSTVIPSGTTYMSFPRDWWKRAKIRFPPESGKCTKKPD